MHCHLVEGEDEVESLSTTLNRWRWRLNSERHREKPYILPSESQNSGFIDLKFTAVGLSCLYFRFKCSTLYGHGYSLDDKAFHEALPNNNSSRVIPNSKITGFTTSHATLSPGTCDVSKRSLIRSLKLLATSLELDKEEKEKKKKEEKVPEDEKKVVRPPSNKELAQAFGVVVTIFSEGARSHCIEIMISINFRDAQFGSLGSWALVWMQHWDKISRVLQMVAYFEKNHQTPRNWKGDIRVFQQQMDKAIKDLGLTVPLLPDGFSKVETVGRVRHMMAMLKYHDLSLTD